MAGAESIELSRTSAGARRVGELRQAAQARYAVEEVKALFAEALAAGAAPNEVFPGLFEGEPHFPSPQVAQQLYGNLFGLWDRIAEGHTEEPPAARPERPARPTLPRPLDPPPVLGQPPDEAYVEQAFRYLTSLPPKERRRLRDRFEQRESDLIQAIATLQVQPAAEEAGVEMGFELWLIAELALGARVGRTDFSQLRAPGEAGANPALEAYLEEWLQEAMLDETDPLQQADRDKLEPMLRAAIAQLVR